MKSYKILTGAVLCLLIHGCATMNKNECLTADWQAVGFEDGSRGAAASRFSQHSKACSKHGISADFSRYQVGHNNGVRTYCTPERGYALGKKNSGIPTICPGDLIEGIRNGYNIGHDIYLQKRELKQEINIQNESIQAIDNDIDLLAEEKEEHEEYLYLAEDGLASPKVSKRDKIYYYTQRIRLKRLIRESDDAIYALESTKQPYYDTIERLNSKIEALDNQPIPKLRP